jgi:excinuclease ABC subunit C
MNFRMINGVMRDSDKFFFDLVGDNDFSNFLFQYYTVHKVPKFIYVNELPKNKILLESLLSTQAGFSVEIICPKRGKKKEIIDLILKNISLIHSKGGNPGLIELKEILHLSVIPNVIECFDISNHGDEFAVGSMSRFVDGKPDKFSYRKFIIKTVSGIDYFAMIGEIIKRRYLRLQEENSQLPDLILIDGGKGQLNAALKSLQSLGLHLDCISLAKENEEVYIPSQRNSIVISKDKSSLKILQHARDESHRFGVTYNRTIRINKIK